MVSAGAADTQSSSLFEESTSKKKSKVSKTGRLTLPQLHELERKKEEEVKRGYKLLCELWPKMLLPQGAAGQEPAEREWLLEAEKLVDMFRETRNLFRTSRVSSFIICTIPNTRTDSLLLSRATRSGACYQRERRELQKKMKMKWHLVSTWTLVSVKVPLKVSDVHDRQDQQSE